MPMPMPTLIGDLSLHHPIPILINNVHLVPVAVVVVAAVVPVVAPLALVGDLASAVAAGGADAVREVYQADDVLLLTLLVSYLCGRAWGASG